MQITRKLVTQITIIGAKALDPIRVIIENEAPGRGHLTISCFAQSWSCHLGSMGRDTVEEFLASVPTSYVVGRLSPATGSSDLDCSASSKAYLTRIVATVQAVLIELEKKNG